MGGFRTLKLLHFRRYLLWYYCLHFDVKYTAKHKTAIKHSTRVLTQFRTQSFAVSAISPNQVVQTLKLFYISDSHLKTFPSPFWWETKTRGRPKMGCPREALEARLRPLVLYGEPAQSDPEPPDDRCPTKQSSNVGSTTSCFRWICHRTGRNYWRVLTTLKSGTLFVTESRWDHQL